jgi:hypothetical protein
MHHSLALRACRFRVDLIAFGIDPAWPALYRNTHVGIHVAIREQYVRPLDEVLNSCAIYSQRSWGEVRSSAFAPASGGKVPILARLD